MNQNQPLTDLQRADRLHELTAMLKALQELVEHLIADAVDPDTAFGVFLWFQVLLANLETFDS